MCIIAIKAKGVPMIGEDTIRTMFANNPDGAGYMWADGKSVHIKKGFMRVNELLDSLRGVQNKEDITLVMHFRIATHGGVCAENTHPFPMSADVGKLQKLQTTTKLGIAHNGIIHAVTPSDKSVSDTMEYIADVLVPLYSVMGEKMLHNKQIARLISSTIDGSRLAMLTPDGVVTTVGNFEESKGVLYSNSSYLPRYSINHKWDSYTTDAYGGGWGSYTGKNFYMCQMNLMEVVEAEGLEGYGHLTGLIMYADGTAETLEGYELFDFAMDITGAYWVYDSSVGAYVPYEEDIEVYTEDGKTLMYNKALAAWADCYDDGYGM